MIRTCLLAQIEAEAQLISTQPLMRSIDSHVEPFQTDLLELSTVKSEIHLWEERKNSKVLTASLTIFSVWRLFCFAILFIAFNIFIKIEHELVSYATRYLEFMCVVF